MDILASLLSTTITRSILRMFSHIIDPLKQKILKKIEKEIEIDKEGKLYFLTETSYPAARLRFKVISKSEIDLHPKHFIAWVRRSGAAIDKISWSWQENIFGKGRLNAFSTGITYHSIPKLPSKENGDFELYYSLPSHVDFGKPGLGLHGIIEFDCSFGTVVKEFEVGFKLSEKTWNEALDIWKESWKNEKTIISSITNLK
ncbi:MAG: hypothetical protein O8C64_05945 [Candidatus Methanoperedens sp.]|nr:hypothetical protein [Candidatus Methanoperedens sp.]MCZ7404956.1 hypothetical protein [Candidatus Methanoperedens sp.]